MGRVRTPPAALRARLLELSPQILGGAPPPRLEDVARLAGVSRATLYSYFGGRDDLVGYLLVAHARSGADVFAGADDPALPVRRRLPAVLSALAGYLGDHPDLCTGLLGAMGAAGRMAEVLETNDTWLARPLRALLEDGRREGSVAAGDAALAADAALGALLLGVVGRAAAGGDPGAPDFRRRLVAQVVRGLLDPDEAGPDPRS